MPRHRRLNIPGAIHHVITRGLNRQDIFLDDCDRNDFLGRLEKNLSLTGCRCYAWVLMSNHVHFVIQTGVGADLRVCPDTDTGEQTLGGEHIGLPLHTVIQWFKTITTNEYIRGVKQNGWSTFPGKLWQRNYYEHIVRNENELNRIREYIMNNPLQWELDRENPNVQRRTEQPQGPAPTKDEPWRA